MPQVTVFQGTYSRAPIENQTFELIKPARQGKNGWYVTVDGSDLTGQPGRNVRIQLDSPDDVEYHGVAEQRASEHTAPRVKETPEQARDRIRRRFEILDQMTDAVTDGVVRGLIVMGPAGVGKSYGVETRLDAYEAENRLRGVPPKVEVVKGTMTAIGLYKTLYDMRGQGDITVFDDCDSILWDETCLNMLKAVLDSGKKRRISWKSESRALRAEDIPDRFDFEGGVIFITNVNFENVRSKKIKPHLDALQSRCHYIDLEMDSENDRFLRIEQIVGDGMLDEYGFGDAGNQEVIDFLRENAARMRELSLRMVLKISDLRKMSPTTWRELATGTCMTR